MGKQRCLGLLVGAGVVLGASVLLAGPANAVDSPPQAPLHQGPCANTPVVGGLLGGTPVCAVVDPVVEVLDPVVAPVVQALDPVTAPISSAVARTGVAPVAPRAAVRQAAPAAAPTPAVAMAAVEPVSGPFVPASFDLGGAPQVGAFNFAGGGLYDYSSLLGGAANFGQLEYGDLFNGYSPEFGILGVEEDSAARDVAAAGRAQALDTDSPERIALPILLAVLMLSGVTAAMLRSWVHSAPRPTVARSG